MNHILITQLQQLNISQACFMHSSIEFGLLLVNMLKKIPIMTFFPPKRRSIKGELEANGISQVKISRI